MQLFTKKLFLSISRLLRSDGEFWLAIIFEGFSGVKKRSRNQLSAKKYFGYRVATNDFLIS